MAWTDITFEELVERGGVNLHMPFARYVKRGDKQIPVDPEEKAEMWKLGDAWYWVEEGVIKTRMGNKKD